MLSNAHFLRVKHVSPADGNAAAAYVGYAFTETSFGYPITPSTVAYELVEEWANAHHRRNAFGTVPTVVMMQHEGGVAGALHGASVTSVLATTFTASQGLLLMLPNLFKMRYARIPAVIHVASRSIINTGGTIECDHSDVMAVRAAGPAMLSSASNQDVHDLAAVTHGSAIKSLVPFVHFYDGFRTSHQITNVEFLEYDDLATLIDHEQLAKFRATGFNPNHPSLRGLALDSAFHFQHDIAAAYGHTKIPGIVEEMMNKVAKMTGRTLNLFDYYGHPEAESVIVVMGSTSQNVKEAIDATKGKYGLVTVRLYRPFSAEHLMKAIPKSCRVITVLDRVREPGAYTGPLHSDVATALISNGDRRLILGGLFGIGGKELTPAQANSVFENSLRSKPRNLFTVGVVDDICGTNLPVPEEIDMVAPGTKQCIFWGLGSDGTVGANKEAIGIICEKTPLYGQGFFTYDAKKSGGITRSHLRFGPQPITSNYQIQRADYVAVHSGRFPKLYPVTTELRQGGTFVLNCPATDLATLENYLPPHHRRQLADKSARLFIIDATKIAQAAGIPGRINLIMQAVFFKLSQVLDVDTAIKLLKNSVQKNYGHQGEKVVNANLGAIDQALNGIKEIVIPASWRQCNPTAPSRFANADGTARMKQTLFPIFEMKGAELKASDFLEVGAGLGPDGMGTTRFEKRGIAVNLPIWEASKCVQCNSCSIGCAHAVIRPQILRPGSGLATVPSRQFPGYDFRIDVSPYDCLGCGVCIERCPAKGLEFKPASDELFDAMAADHNRSLKLSDIDILCQEDSELQKRLEQRKFTADGSQYVRPLLEYSGACGGCHETLYGKMLSQLFGSRLIIANATGCSIIWSAAFPSVPWTMNRRGQGPAWGNSLFEDNAEYGLGIYTAFAHRREELKKLVIDILKRPDLSKDFRTAFEDWLSVYLNGEKSVPASNLINDLFAQQTPAFLDPIKVRRDLFVKPAVWIVGGDGWANDIGFGGVDHVLASGADVKILVYDNESYANTGFQMSKSTPRGAVMKFAATGNDKPKKNLTQMMLQYPTVYVANCVIAADPRQTIRAMKEAESHFGSAFINAYCPCIGHGIRPTMQLGHRQAKLAVESGYYPLFRRDPNAAKQFVLDSSTCKKDALREMIQNEVRYDSLKRMDQARFDTLYGLLSKDIEFRWAQLQKLAKE
jgi:pyruvate-ferredoxin/flavodoxin oxidoreductase